VYAAQIQRRESRKLWTNDQCPLDFQVESIAQFLYIKFDHRANNYSKYADWFHNCMIDHKDGYIPSPQIMFTCTMLCHALLEWQKIKGGHQKAFKSILNADRPDCSNYYTYKNNGGNNASCCAVTGCKLLILSGIADTYTLLMNTWNTVLESYQQRVHKNTLVQSSIRSNRQRTQCLPWSSWWKQHVLTMLILLTIWPLNWHWSSLRSEALTRTCW